MSQGFTSGIPIDTNTSLLPDSDFLVPSQHAVKTYVDNEIAGAGTVTSVAALTLGTSGTDLSSTVANSTTTPVITLNVPTASALNRGVLSAADFTAFNSKEPAITWLQGDLLYGTGVNTYAKLAKNATTQRVLTNDGTSNNPAWSQVDLTTGVTGILPIASGGTTTGLYGGWDLLGTVIANNTSSIDFTGLSSTYTSYKLVISNMLPQTNGVTPYLRFGTGAGPTWASGAADYSYTRMYSVDGALGGTGSLASNHMLITGTPSMPNTANNTSNAEILIVNPSQTSDYHQAIIQSSFRVSPNHIIQSVAGWYLSTTAVTGVRVIMSTGNVGSGTFKLYGIR